MPKHSNNKNTNSTAVNFAASHDQASLLKQMSAEFEELKKVEGRLELEKQEILSLVDLKTKTSVEELQEIFKKIDEKKTEAINLVKYAQQRVTDLHEHAKKLNPIYQTSPEEKLKKARLLLPADKPLNKDEIFRFKKIEGALSNTCIIKSAGEETIKFQLGVLWNAINKNTISESEFNHLVVLRLEKNNLLDAYRLRLVEGMILDATSLEICQAIAEDLSADADYKKSKELFTMRLKGIEHELKLEKVKELEHSLQEGRARSVTSLWKELYEKLGNSEESSGQELPLNLPEVMDAPLPDPGLQEKLYVEGLKHYSEKASKEAKEVQEKSEFVELMLELLPEKREKEIQIDRIISIPLEKFMKITLERPSSVSEEKKRNINLSNILNAHKVTRKAYQAVLENIENLSYTNNFDSLQNDMARDLSKLQDDRAKEIKETKPCQLTREELVKTYYEYGKRYLENCKTQIEERSKYLDKDPKGYIFRYKIGSVELKFSPKSEKKATRKKIRPQEKRKLDTLLNETNRQKALWERKKTYEQKVFDKKSETKQEIPIPEKELEFRDLVLNYNPNHESEKKELRVYLDAVRLTSIKENTTDSTKSAETPTAASQFELSPKRAPVFFNKPASNQAINEGKAAKVFYEEVTLKDNSREY